jgi:hypothetical protein
MATTKRDFHGFLNRGCFSYLIIPIYRLSAAIILEIMYGYEVKSKDDSIVKVVERAVAQIIENGANPSVAALNVFPILRRLPRWFPGTSFHKIIDDCRGLTKDMLNIPFEYVKESMVICMKCSKGA